MGFTSTRILLFQSINSVIALIGEACCVVWIDSTGRRRPLIVGNIMSGLSFVVGAILMARYPGTVHKCVVLYYPFFLVVKKPNLIVMQLIMWENRLLPAIAPVHSWCRDYSLQIFISEWASFSLRVWRAHTMIHCFVVTYALNVT